MYFISAKSSGVISVLPSKTALTSSCALYNTYTHTYTHTHTHTHTQVLIHKQMHAHTHTPFISLVLFNLLFQDIRMLMEKYENNLKSVGQWLIT